MEELAESPHSNPTLFSLHEFEQQFTALTRTFSVFLVEWFHHQVLQRPTFPTMRSHVLVVCLLVTFNYSSIQIIEPQILYIDLQWTALPKMICRTFLCQCVPMRILLLTKPFRRVSSTRWYLGCFFSINL